MILKTMMAGVLLTWSLYSTAVSAAQQDQPELQRVRTVDVKVVDAETSKPVPRASLRVSWSDHKETDSTDESGTFSIQLPSEYGFIVVYAQAPGYAATRLGYYGRHGRPADVPDETTIVLSHAVTIGGRIVNEEGQPVTGASVTVSGTGEPDPQSPAQAQFDETKLTTDDQGRWTFDAAPEPLRYLTLKVEHPDYVALNEHHSQQQFGTQPASTLFPKLREMTGATTLQHGVKVEGQVLDPAGKPVQGATIATAFVTVAMNFEQWGFPSVSATSDAEGRWSFRALPGHGWMYVEAPDLSPLQREFNVSNESQPLEIHLENGWVLRGRVVDLAGKPRPNISVTVGSWGNRVRRYPLQWRGKTDAQGKFEWHNAPDDGVVLELYGSNVMRLGDVTVARSDEELEFKMPPSLRFSGTVSDSKTKQPISSFTVMPGAFSQWSPGVRWDRSSAEVYRDGTFQYAIDFPQDGHAIRIEADGYLPFESARFANEDGLQHLDVRLEPGERVTGIVKGQDGQPLTGVEVRLITRKSPYFLDGRVGGVEESAKTTTDGKGSFSFSPQTDPFALLAMNDSGVCIVDGAQIKNNPALVLQPWARVEGNVKSEGKPCPGRNVSLTMYQDQNDPRSSVVVRPYTITDDSGHFVFDKAPPGLGRVEQNLPIGDNLSMSSLLATFEATPGKTIQVDPTASGLNAVGRVVLPKGNVKPVPFTKTQCILSTSSEPPKPDNWADMSNDDKALWWKNWMVSDEARQWRLEQFRHERYYLTFLAADGAFRFEGIQPGEYKLRVTVNDPESSGLSPGDALASLNQDINISADPGSTADLGELELALETNVRVGDQAPDFSITTLDDKPLKLADYRGKFVFLDFWATWCGPCKAEIPNVKAMQQALHDRDDFVVISLSLDKDAAAPRKYAQDNQMTWTQGFLGDWNSSDVPKLYGVRGIPATFLVGPDGKVIAKELRGPEMLTKVQSALKLANR